MPEIVIKRDTVILRAVAAVHAAITRLSRHAKRFQGIGWNLVVGGYLVKKDINNVGAREGSIIAERVGQAMSN